MRGQAPDTVQRVQRGRRPRTGVGKASGLWTVGLWIALQLVLGRAWADKQMKLSLAVREVARVEGVYAAPLAVSPDGKTWAAGQQRTLALFQGDTPLRALSSVWIESDASLRFSADGQKISSGGRLYSLGDGKELFSPSAERLSEYRERGWEIDAAELSSDLTQCVAWLRYHPSRCCRERGHRDAPTRKPTSPLFVIEVATHKAKALPIEDSFGEFRALAFSRRHLVVGGVRHRAAVFDRQSLAQVAMLPEQGAFYRFVFSADERLLAAIHLGRWLLLYDGERFDRRARIEVLPDGLWISALALSPKLPIAAVSGGDEVLRLYSTEPGDEGRLLWSSKLGHATALAFSASGDELLVALSGPKNRVVRLSLART